MDLLTAITGLIITLMGTMFYFAKVKQRQTPKLPVLFFAALIVGSCFSLLALFFTFQSFSILSVAVIVIAVMQLMMTALFYITFKQAKTPLGNLQVSVGDKLLEFEATTSEGTRFSSQSFKGQRVLLKFYRGAWCPYCSTELMMFDEMKPLFDNYNVNVIAISNDQPESAKKHKRRDNLSHLLLTDPSLKIIKQFGVEHHKALGGDSAAMMTISGLPFPKMIKYKPMAIPTTLLIDEHGTVVWIDQSDDVRLRANEDMIKKALHFTFD
ncbi:peroxiredoxin family protein [Shewanella frigidimarina]|uniref:peroxiredoxin family protein n=1 Tax=Shewanella frigidimarina TaxID=56812 RepID=UPI003D7A81DF